MAKQLINLGTTPNDRSGDTLRDAGSKMNSNVNELYTALGNGSTLQIAVSGATNGQVLKYNGTSFVPSTDLNTDAVISVNTKTGAVVLSTDDVAEGTTNKYYTDSLARAAISASGALSYDSSTGVITGPTIAPVGLSNDYNDLDNTPTTFSANAIDSGTVPTTASDTGTAGTVVYDADYIYVCVATDTWKRAALSTW